MKGSGNPREEFSLLFSELKSTMPEEGVYDSVYVVQNGKFRFVNPQFAAAGGFTEKEMLGMESARLIHPNDQEEARENAIKMLKGERTLPYTFRIIAKDGSVKWIQETVHAITYKGKRAVLGNSMDVTAHREAMEKLRDLQALQNSILDALPIAVLGMHARRIVLANHAVEAVFGWKPQELIGQNSRVLYRNDRDYAEIGKAVYRALQRQRTYKMEFPCRRKDGEDIICLLSVARIGEYLQDRRIIATYEDITEHKQAEKALKESERTLKELLRSYQRKA
ncbi:MAG TPA: PAS domain-containing protein [Syntrophales bacterium]|nr:PAS domain-containing protein [Syntrophales bacterium]